MLTYQRGFFCSDLSIRYPYHECTITVPMLLVCMLLLPMLFLSVVEIMRLCHNFRMRQYLRNASFSLGCFSFGFIATYLSTELAKNVVRRLRPHFYMACKPQLNDGSTCEDVKNRNLFVEHYYCSERNLSSRQIRELYVSFPSAHSSLSFYAMLFLAFYLHAIWREGRGVNRVLRHLLQFLFLSMAWFISLSRVADYWHHWSDVMAGAVMGIIYAMLTAVYVGRFLSLHPSHGFSSSGSSNSSASSSCTCTTNGQAKQACQHNHQHHHHNLQRATNKLIKSSLKKPLQHVGSTVSFNQTLSHDSHQQQQQQHQHQLQRHHQSQQQQQTQLQSLPQHNQTNLQRYTDQTSVTTLSGLTTAASSVNVLEAFAAPADVAEELLTLASSAKQHLIASNDSIWKTVT